VIIRPYKENDIEEVRRLCEEFIAMIKNLLPEELYRFEAMAENGIESWISEAVQPEKGFFVAEAEPGHLAGFIQGYIEDHKEVKLNRWGIVDAFFVSVDCRGQGTGSDLFDTLEKWFAGQGCLAVRVDTWLTNTPAIEAYQAMGFKLFYTGFVKEIYHR
jgi:GNAT superfamily N-acetyltransferase